MRRVPIRWRVKHRLRESVAYAYAAAPIPVAEKRVVIYGQGRTGSTLLESLLHSTGHLEALGEALNPTKGEILYPRRFLRGLAKRHSNDNVVFHLKHHHLAHERRRAIDPGVFVRNLHTSGWKVIYLRRENKIRHALSYALTLRRGRSHKLDDSREELRLRIAPDEFIRRVEQRFRYEAEERRALHDVDYMEVVYEADLESAKQHQSVVDRALDYLDLEPRQARTNHRRINTLPLSDLLENYDEIREIAADRGWERFLT